MKLFRAGAECSERHACGQLEVLRAMLRYRRRESRFAEANQRLRLRLRELAEELPISRPAVSRHLRLLKDAGLVGEVPSGTQRIYGLRGEGIAALEGFVRNAAAELPRGLRINLVSPGWISETLQSLGEPAAGGTPAAEVARAYARLVEGTAQGEIVRP